VKQTEVQGGSRVSVARQLWLIRFPSNRVPSLTPPNRKFARPLAPTDAASRGDVVGGTSEPGDQACGK
jgi:hypothetical protein